MNADTDDLRFELVDRVAILTLNRPDKLNALSEPMIDAAIAHLERCATDPEVGAILLTGAAAPRSRAFSAPRPRGGVWGRPSRGGASAATRARGGSSPGGGGPQRR